MGIHKSSVDHLPHALVSTTFEKFGFISNTFKYYITKESGATHLPIDASAVWKASHHSPHRNKFICIPRGYGVHASLC